MTRTHDYSAVRTAIARAVEFLDRASHRDRPVNLPPGMNPGDVNAQIGDIDLLLTEAAEELMAARATCSWAGRSALTLVGAQRRSDAG